MHVARLQDWVVILTVMGSFAALYLSAAFILLRPFLLPPQIRTKLGPMGFLVLFLTAFSFVCLGYAAFVEPYSLEVTHVKIPLRKLPPTTKPIYIVQVSDTHCDHTVRLENRVAEEIEKIKPSLILFTGDAVNSLDAAETFNTFAARISKVAPTFAVKGDWDFAFNADPLKASGLEILGGYKVIELNGIPFCIVGVDSGITFAELLPKCPVGIPRIVMYHNPDADFILNKKTDGVDLYVCGHTHGGQIALPKYGALITQSVQGKKYESGLHKLNDTWIYTTRGIGMEGHFPRLRFFARPELTVFELCSSEQPPD